MAGSIYKRKNGYLAFNFIAPDGKKRTWYFTKEYTREDAESLRVFIVELLKLRSLGVTPNALQLERIQSTPTRVQKRLFSLNIVEETAVCKYVPTLAEFCAEYVGTRTGLSASAKSKDETVITKLLLYFGAETRLDKVTPWEAEKFCAWLRRPVAEGGRGNAPTTFGRELRDYKRIFRKAMKAGFVKENPFEDLKGGGKQTDKLRQKYVERKRIWSILERLDPVKDADLRFVVALARFGGLRIPSEIRRLKFADFDFEEGFFYIDEKTKTGARRVPLFPEIRRELERYRAATGLESGLVFPKLLTKRNIGTKLRKRLKKMGEPVWPKIFVNLRASLITDLVAMALPEATISAWVGNSDEVRRCHYIMQREEDERRAIAAILESEDETPYSSATVWKAKSTSQSTLEGVCELEKLNFEFENGLKNGFSNMRDERPTFEENALFSIPPQGWSYAPFCELIEDELDNIINAPIRVYDEEPSCFDEDEPTAFEQSYPQILAVLRAAKAGEERLREYVRQQAEFLGITGKHARGESNPQPAD